MKVVTMLFAIAAVALSYVAQAADSSPRHEATLDTGKGGLHLVFSTPNFTEGPIDFAGNKGPALAEGSRVKLYEVAFNAQVGKTGVIVYKATVSRKLDVQKGDRMVTADFMAADILKSEGFTLDRATKIDSPPVPITDATIVTYKAAGYSGLPHSNIIMGSVQACSFSDHRPRPHLCAAGAGWLFVCREGRDG